MTAALLDPQWEPPAPPPKPGTNGAALISLYFGVTGLCTPFALLGLVFGIIALAQVRKSRQKGKALALVGICLSWAWILVAVAVVVTDMPLAR